MKTEFRLNGTKDELLLIPESGRDRTLSQLFMEGKKFFKITMKNDVFVVEATDPVSVAETDRSVSVLSANHQESVGTLLFHRQDLPESLSAKEERPDLRERFLPQQPLT